MITKTGSELLEKEANLLRTGANMLRRGVRSVSRNAKSLGANWQAKENPFMKNLGKGVSTIGTTLNKSRSFLPRIAKAPTAATQASTAMNNAAPAAAQAAKQPGFLWRNKGRIAAGGLTIGTGALALRGNKDTIRNPQQAPGAENLQQPNSYPHHTQQYF